MISSPVVITGRVPGGTQPQLSGWRRDQPAGRSPRCHEQLHAVLAERRAGLITESGLGLPVHPPRSPTRSRCRPRGRTAGRARRAPPAGAHPPRPAACVATAAPVPPPTTAAPPTGPFAAGGGGLLPPRPPARRRGAPRSFPPKQKARVSEPVGPH